MKNHIKLITYQPPYESSSSKWLKDYKKLNIELAKRRMKILEIEERRIRK